MKPIRNKVICGDSLEEMKKIPTGSVKAVITDPPYFIGFNSSATEGGRQDWGNNTVLNPMFDAIFTEIKRVLSKDGVMFMFTDWRTYPTLYNRCSRFFNIRNLIVWDYGWIKAGTGFRFTHELIVYAEMPEANKPKDRALSDVWRHKPINFTAKRKHPAEKPVNLMETMLKNCTDQGDLVLDCFAGSGPVGVACKKLGRDYLLIEINPSYIDIINSRLQHTQKQTNLLEKEKVGLDKYREVSKEE